MRPATFPEALPFDVPLAWSQTGWPFPTECSLASVCLQETRWEWPPNFCNTRASAVPAYTPIQQLTIPQGRRRTRGGGPALHFDPWSYLTDLCVTFLSATFARCLCSSRLHTCFCVDALSLRSVCTLISHDRVRPGLSARSVTLIFILVFFCLTCVIRVHRAPCLIQLMEIYF